MALTKQGNALLAVPLHIIQNKALQKMLNNKSYHKALWQHVYNGATGNRLLSKDSARLVHGLGPALPEVKILADEAYHSGEALKRIVAASGNGAPDLHALAKIRRAAVGNFDALTRRPLTKPEVEAMVAVLGRVAPNADPAVAREILTNFTPEKAQALKKLMADNPLTGKLLRGVAEQSKLPSPTVATKNTITMDKASKVYGRPANVAINGALAVVDPATAAINLSKQVMFSRDMANKYSAVKKLQNITNEYMVKRPAIKAYNNGATAKSSLFKHLYDKHINPDLINPINAYATQFAEGLGKINKMS